MYVANLVMRVLEQIGHCYRLTATIGDMFVKKYM